MPYRNIFVLDDGSVWVRQSRLATPVTELYANRPKGARMITRYFPSKKGWRVYDIRTFNVIVLPGGRERMNYPQPEVTLPTEEAAIAFAVLVTVP